MDADRNLLFGVLTLQADLIDSAQFIEACLLWTMRKSDQFADLLAERGWIEPADRAHIEYLIERKLQKHGGNVHAGLAAIPDDIKRSLAALGDDDIRRSLAGEPFPESRAAATIDFVPGRTERYRRRLLHAIGGIGRVWLAHDNELGRDVALKELRPERAEEAALQSRFLQEARITGQLEHPGIIPVYELSRPSDGGQPFYTMRFVKGRTLSEAAREFHERRASGQVNTLEMPALLNAFVTVCNTVAYAHSRAVIHRDLKGQNVILGDFGEVVVLDWGLAKLVGRQESEASEPSIMLDKAGADSSHTVHGQALGTPAYMAPEQAAGRSDQIDRHTDVYGLGAILYEILTGVPPFTGESTEEVLRKVREEAPMPPRQLWAEVPPALDALCLRALAKQPTDRPVAAVDLAHAVQGWQESERRKAEEALRESEALYHSLVESLPCVVVRKDLEGRFTFGNHCYSELLGCPLEQIIGKTDFDFFPRALAEKYRRDDRTVLASGRVLEVIEPVPRDTGMHYLHVLKTGVRDAAGQLAGIQLIGWDITQRKQAEETLARERDLLNTLMDNLPDGIYFKDTSGRFLRVNKAVAYNLGLCEPAEMVGKTDFDFFTEKCALAAAAAEQTIIQTGQPLVDVEEKMTFHDGRVEWVSTTKLPFRDNEGKIIGTFGVSRNTSARKRSEEAPVPA